MESFSFYTTPKPLARFKINGVTFELNNKKDIPCRFNRWMQKIILGIEWEVL